MELAITPSPPVAASKPSGASAAAWTHRALLTRGTRLLALFAMVVSVFFPVSGLSVDLCALHSATGLPCPGCGLTRGISAMTQGQFSTAVALNPFVLVFWPTLAFLAVLAVLPKATVARVEARMDRWGAPLTRVYRLVLFAFLGFGVLRFATFLVLGEHFP